MPVTSWSIFVVKCTATTISCTLQSTRSFLLFLPVFHYFHLLQYFSLPYFILKQGEIGDKAWSLQYLLLSGLSAIKIFNNNIVCPRFHVKYPKCFRHGFFRIFDMEKSLLLFRILIVTHKKLEFTPDLHIISWIGFSIF